MYFCFRERWPSIPWDFTAFQAAGSQEENGIYDSNEPPHLHLNHCISTNEPLHLHHWTTASPPMSHPISSYSMSHLQWAISSPPMIHRVQHISSNEPPQYYILLFLNRTMRSKERLLGWSFKRRRRRRRNRSSGKNSAEKTKRKRKLRQKISKMKEERKEKLRWSVR